MNIFFKIDGKIITPNLDGAILSGITRMSTIDLLRSKGYEVTERPITMDEIIEAEENGTLEEAFGTGTAVGIAYIQTIGTDDRVIKISEEHPVGLDVNDSLNAIKMGKVDDPFGWIVKI